MIAVSYHLTPNIFLSSPLISIISSIQFYELTVLPQNSPGVNIGGGPSVIEVRGSGITLPGTESGK